MISVDKQKLYEIAGGIDKIKATREEKQVGTNCEGFRVSFRDKKGKKCTYFMKKSLLKNLGSIEEDYDLLKKELKNLVPNTVFIQLPEGDIFSFSEPVLIDFDILKEENREYLKTLLQEDAKLVKQLQFFIRKFRELEERGKILDLYGGENLVYTSDNKIKYIDSYVVFGNYRMIIEVSIQKIEYLEKILQEINL